jgi:DNA-binding IclR family transcriptional regulator
VNIENPTGTQAVVRALGLLKQFHARPQLSAAELQQRSGLNRTTVARLLRALEVEGMLERDAVRKQWRLGPQVAALGRVAGAGGNLAELAAPELQALASRLHETVTLEVLHEQSVSIIAEALGSQVLGAMPSLGTSWPAHATATGKVLWAALDEQACAAILARRRRRCTAHTLTTRAQLVTELERVRREGFATNLEELELGYVAIAVPVRDARGQVVAALSLGGPRQRLSRARLRAVVDALDSSSARIARHLGA